MDLFRLLLFYWAIVADALLLKVRLTSARRRLLDLLQWVSLSGTACTGRAQLSAHAMVAFKPSSAGRFACGVLHALKDEQRSWFSSRHDGEQTKLPQCHHPKHMGRVG